MDTGAAYYGLGAAKDQLYIFLFFREKNRALYYYSWYIKNTIPCSTQLKMELTLEREKISNKFGCVVPRLNDSLEFY